MKIIGFVGSPHKSGNTAWAVEKVLEGAKQTGADTVLFSSGSLDMKPCKGCLGCVNNSNGCVIKDDMQKIYTEVKDADAIVFASPVYMGQMTGQAKVFMDRLFSVNKPRFSPHYKEQKVKKKLLLVFTQGNPDETKFKAYFDYTKMMFEMLEYDTKDTIVVAGTRSEEAKDISGLGDSLLSIGVILGA